MTPAPSLQRRLGLWLGGGIAGVWLATALWSLLSLSASIERDFDQSLKAAGEQLMPLAMVRIFERDDDAAQIIAEFDHNSASARLAYAVQDRSGRVLLASRGYSALTLPTPGTTGWSDQAGMRRYSLTALNAQITMTVSEPLAARRSALRSASVRLLLPVALVLPLCLLLIAVVLRRELAAVSRLNGQIARRGQGDLTPLANDGVARELAGVSASVNARECHELCVSVPVHAGFRCCHALKRSSNMIANWLRAANHSRTFLPPFSKLRIAR